MSSKMRRTPLFGYDGNLGIPMIPAKSTSSSSSTETSNIERSDEMTDSILERVASLEDKVENLTRTVDSKLDIILLKLQ